MWFFGIVLEALAGFPGGRMAGVGAPALDTASLAGGGSVFLGSSIHSFRPPLGGPFLFSVAIEPAVVGMPAPFTLADFDHRFPP